MVKASVYVLLSVIAVCYASFTGKNYSLVLVGGGLDENNYEIWNTIIGLGGGVGKARFGVISAASENPCCNEDSSWVYYQELLTKYGAAEVYYIPVTVDTKGNNTDPGVIAHIKTLSGFFFGGGDQSRIIYSFYNNNEKQPSDALMAIKETLLETGGVVAGTSAGTDVQTSHTMITGGVSYTGILNGTTTFWYTAELPNPNKLSGYGPGGIGLFPYGLIDTHFANRGRQGRLVSLVVDTISHPVGEMVAYGVDENTALVVTGPWTRRVGKVIGERGVFVVDVSHSSVTKSNLRDLRRVRTSRMSSGDSIALSSLEISFADYKTPMTSRESPEPPLISQDIFSEYTYEYDSTVLSLLSSTADFTQGFTKETSPKFVVTLRKNYDSGSSKSGGGCGSVGYDGIDPTTGLYAFGYECVWLDIAPAGH